MAEFAQLGIGGLDVGAWDAAMASARTPPEVILPLHAAVLAAGATPIDGRATLHAAMFSADAGRRAYCGRARRTGPST
ncbi:hypothetical protein [Plastoroseomonas arctica]|uniref:Uncharacterized protein n=1 Tax=Plastoroseomonas arctica TaxID=1509237 RepID=A0AAF1JZQ8_9PROT|nr:hypothetical protein [Plastoroseomonas arctica]MBR0654528.1 hypothetical protein [Plastoroseomonas arctica]